mmetsp:Transcript_28217/g.79658  ORF Transcript_28217/g.79658 Transcript_28217/m.79658 type:complete len:200 (-) Transcript_28217:355-954(-)
MDALRPRNEGGEDVRGIEQPKHGRRAEPTGNAQQDVYHPFGWQVEQRPEELLPREYVAVGQLPLEAPLHNQARLALPPLKEARWAGGQARHPQHGAPLKQLGLERKGAAAIDWDAAGVAAVGGALVGEVRLESEEQRAVRRILDLLHCRQQAPASHCQALSGGVLVCWGRGRLADTGGQGARHHPLEGQHPGLPLDRFA